MEVEFVKTQERQHVQSAVGKALVAAGLAKEILPKVDRKPPNLIWSARIGYRDSDYQYPPEIHHYCSTCGVRGMTESQRGTAYQSAIAHHCGIIERCPEDVAAQYQTLFVAWKSRSKRKDGAAKVSAAYVNGKHYTPEELKNYQPRPSAVCR